MLVKFSGQLCIELLKLWLAPEGFDGDHVAFRKHRSYVRSLHWIWVGKFILCAFRPRFLVMSPQPLFGLQGSSARGLRRPALGPDSTRTRATRFPVCSSFASANKHHVLLAAVPACLATAERDHWCPCETRLGHMLQASFLTPFRKLHTPTSSD